MTSETEHGYLFLADISGYTSYLAQVEKPYLHWFENIKQLMERESKVS